MLGFDFWRNWSSFWLPSSTAPARAAWPSASLAASAHHPRLRLPSEAGQTPGRRHPDDSVRDLRLRRPPGCRRPRLPPSDRRKDAPQAPARGLLPRSVPLLVPRPSLRHGPRCVHDAPDYLRRRIKNGIRPERPMAASTIASQMSIICSPAAVAAVSMIALCDGYQVGGKAFGFIQLFSITIPGASSASSRSPSSPCSAARTSTRTKNSRSSSPIPNSASTSTAKRRPHRQDLPSRTVGLPLDLPRHGCCRRRLRHVP